MVIRVTSLTGNGLADFVLQRVSAYAMLAYSIFLLIVLLPGLSYQELKTTFSTPIVQWSTLFVILLLAAHAWIGLWTVGTDYIRERTFGRLDVWFRSLYQLGCGALIIFYIFWCIQILWDL